MGVPAWLDRLLVRQRSTPKEAGSFPVDVFWRSVRAMGQPILLVSGSGLQVMAATEEAHELFCSRNIKDISSLLRSGLDPHTMSRLQLAAMNSVALVSELPVRLQGPDVTVNATITVTTLPEYPAVNAALLVFKATARKQIPSWSGITREVLSWLPNPAWVVDPYGSVVFSNAAFIRFPLELLNPEAPSAEEFPDRAEREFMIQVHTQLELAPISVRNTESVTEATYDLGSYGRWRVMHFPLGSREGEGFVGVIAIDESDMTAWRLSQQDALRLDPHHVQDNLTQVLQVKEAERAALAREVHDSLGQELTVLKLELKRMYNLILGSSVSSTLVLEHFVSIKKHVDELAKSARRIAYEMRQDLVNVNGVARAAQDLVLELRSRLGMQIQLEITSDWIEPDPGLAHHLHRSLQEMLNNVSKHAKAKVCFVRMGICGATYWLEVRDDGVGMPAIRKTRSIGLNSLAERAGLFGGKVTIKTRPDVNGTEVRIEFPERRAGRVK